LHDAGLLQLVIGNATDRTFTGVRVELTLPAGVEACVWRRDVEGEAKLPQAPEIFGSGIATVGRHSWAVGLLSDMSVVRPVWLPMVDSSGNATRVVFADEEVHAEGRCQLPDIWLLLDHDAPVEVTVEWHMFASPLVLRELRTLSSHCAAQWRRTTWTRG
jgi:hypothetical protein